MVMKLYPIKLDRPLFVCWYRSIRLRPLFKVRPGLFSVTYGLFLNEMSEMSHSQLDLLEKQIKKVIHTEVMLER